MRGLKRKVCDSLPCREQMPFFRPLVRPEGRDPAFFPLLQGYHTTAEKLGEQKPFKDWYEPKVEHLEFALWDRTLRQDRSAMLTYLGLNLSTSASSFEFDPHLRARK